MEAKENNRIKDKVIDILNTHGIPYCVAICGGCERICISLENEQNDLCSPSIIVQDCNKDIYKVHFNQILYVAIENRKTVFYLTDKKIETNYPLSHWKSILYAKNFVQPHYSYIVNLNYVYEVTNDFVTLKCCEKEYKIYTSFRKINAFKKAVLNFGENFSGGECQRLSLARALYRDAPVLLLDEPTSALDAETSKKIIDMLLAENKQKNKTIVMITHDIKKAFVADKVVVINDGNIVECGRAIDLLEKKGAFASLMESQEV